MIRVLAIETSGRSGSVALGEDDRIIAEGAFAHGLQHAAKLLPMIDDLTRHAGWRPNDIDHVYLSIGPGSFTGLRIGVTLAKTLAMATGAKIVAVPSARVLLENAPAEATEVVIVLDAKRGQIFTARYARTAANEDWNELEPAHLDTLAAILARAGRPVHLIGEGIPYHQAALVGEAGVIVTDSPLWQARASAVFALGRTAAVGNSFADPLTLTPLYVRLPEAEEKRLAAGTATC